MKANYVVFSCVRAKVICFALFLLTCCPYAFSQTPNNYGWQVGYGYSVGATIVKGDTMYVGGDFDYIGHYTGSLVEADLAANGTIKTTWPVVNGIVRAMIADGSGGWFIGGDFTLVNGNSRKGLAHINALKQLDLSWNINVNDGARVDALLLSPANDILWVGGTFNSLGGIANNKVASINMSTRSVISGWGPGSAIGDNWWATGTVSAMVYYAPVFGLPGDVPRLFIGGDFRNASWQEVHLTALDPSTGKVISGWKSDLVHYGNSCCGTPVTPVVRSLALYGRNLFIGGLFSSITDNNGTIARQSLAKMDVYTDKTDNSFNADIIPKNDSGLINCIKLINTPLGARLAIAGKFRNVASRGVQNFTIVDAGFGLAWPYQNGSPYVNGLVLDTTYTPGIYQTGEIFSIDTVGSTMYLAGNFEGIKSSGSTVQIRRNLAALDMKTNAISSWGPVMQTDLPVRTITISGTDMFIGGSFTSAGGWFRRNLAAVDIKKDTILSFNPQPDSYVNAFALTPAKDILYIGGNFANVGSSQRGYTAAIDVSTNALLAWSTATASGGGVEDIKLDAARNILYAGGKFTAIGGQSRSHLAAINASTGAVITGWAANIATINAQITPVRSLALSQTGDTLYIGGRFNSIAGQSRANLAAVKTTMPGLPSTATASLLSWNFPVTPAALTPDMGICALSLYNGRLYLGGKFDAVNGNTSIANLGAINVSGAVHTLETSWAPKIEYGGVWCMQPVGNVLYFGGDFGSVNTVVTSYASAVSLTDGSIVAGWLPFPTKASGGLVLNLMVSGQFVYLGGSQEAMTRNVNDMVFHLATVKALSLSVLSSAIINFTATLSGNNAVVLQWLTDFGQAKMELERSTDGRSFASIAYNASAAGDKYIDQDVQPGRKYYYRLKLTDERGATKYSAIREAETSKNASVLIQTLITKGSQLKISTPGKGYMLIVLTTGGQRVFRQSLNEGLNEIPCGKLAKGMYLYIIVDDNDRGAGGKLVIE